MGTISIPAAEAKQHLSDYLSRSAHSKCRVIVTRRGRPMAAIVSIQDLRDLEQFDERKGLTSIVGKWRRFSEIAGAVRSARTSGGRGRDVSL